jgi:ABC-2 type transport system ATP-binding protein
MPLIAANALTKEYRTHKRFEGLGGAIRTLFTTDYMVTRAVDRITFDIERGELIGYIGPNGAGKSTTFKMLTGVLTPTGGTVVTAGVVPHKHRQRLARRIGAVFGQRTQLWWDLPLVESLRILQAIYRVPEERYQHNLAAFDASMGLGQLLSKPVRQLSLGQRMRGELAAAFLHDPDIVFLDEPLLGLDVVAKDQMRRFIAEINAGHGATILLASNDMDDVEQVCRRLMIIDKGQLLYDGTVAEIKQRYAPYRTLVVHFAGESPEAQVEGASVVRREDSRTWFRFGRSVNPQRLIADLGGRYSISDLAIEEPTLEDVIRGLYQSPDQLRHDDAGK